LSKTKTSKPESSGTKAAPPVLFDKLYWIRIVFGAVAGGLANWISGLDPNNSLSDGVVIAIGFYLISFYLARYGLYRKAGKESLSKFYTTGIGAYVMLFLFTWVLLFTLR